ncbi:MerR family transcriptional regulator [Luteococcus sp. H101]
MGHTIGEVATQLGLATSTLRYYEAEGLLPSVERSAGGRRLFSQRDVEACRVIECLKASGLSIRQIKDFMDMVAEGDSSLPARLELFRSRREAVRQQVRELEQVLAVLDYKAWYYEQAVAAGTEAGVGQLGPDDLPAEHRAAKEHLGSQIG